MTLYTCVSSRGIVLDLALGLDSVSFIKSFHRFICRRGCPSNVISDNGKSFVMVETKRFVSSVDVNWITNLPLVQWHRGFFERLVKSTKTILQKQLEISRLNNEELQTVLCEVETILNNRPLTYYYSDNTEQCPTPNHLLFGRTIKLFDPEPIEITHDINLHSKKIRNINHFWEQWRREYLNMLHENHKITSTNKNHPTIRLNDVVLTEEERKPRST